MNYTATRETRDELEKANWTEIWPRLHKYAGYKVRNARRYGLRNHDPQHLVNEAISLSFGGREDKRFRHWNREKYPDLVNFLMSVISSLAYHETGKDQKENTEHLDPHLEKSLEPCQYQIMTNYTTIPLSPDEALEWEENGRELITKLEAALEKDEDAQLVLLAIREGLTKPQDIAQAWGIPVGRVYKARDRMRKNPVLNATKYQ